MDTMKEFKKLVKSLPENQRVRLPEKIRQFVNRNEHSDYLKAIALGAVLNFDYEISLIGYVKVPTEISSDEQYCTAIKDCNTDKMIIGTDEITSTMSVQDFKNKILYA